MTITSKQAVIINSDATPMPVFCTIDLSPVTCGTLLSINVWIRSWSLFCLELSDCQILHTVYTKETKEASVSINKTSFYMLTPHLTLTSDSFFLIAAESPDVSDQCCSSSPAVISQSVSSLTASRYCWCSNTTPCARRTRS